MQEPQYTGKHYTRRAYHIVYIMDVSAPKDVDHV